MSLSFAIQPANTLAAVAGAVGQAVAKADPGAADTAQTPLQMLFATLVGLADKTAGQTQSANAAANGAIHRASAGLSLNVNGLISLNGSISTGANKATDSQSDASDPGTPSPLAAAIDALLGALQPVLSQIEAGQTPSAEGLADAKTALGALGQLGKALAAGVKAASADNAGQSPIVPAEGPQAVPTGLAKLLSALTGDSQDAQAKALSGVGDRLQTSIAALDRLGQAATATASTKTDTSPANPALTDFLNQAANLARDLKAIAGTATANTANGSNPAAGSATAASPAAASQALASAQANAASGNALSPPQVANPAALVSPAASTHADTAKPAQGLARTGPAKGVAATAAKAATAATQAQRAAQAATEPDAAAGTAPQDKNTSMTGAPGTTAASPTVTVTNAHSAATAVFRPAASAYNPQQTPLNMPGIAYEFARQVSAGNSKFSIRLDPPEMGRIDVKLDINKTGSVHAHLTVERAETLDLLQRDARGLEKALAQAGLDAGKTNLEFSLKQNPFAGQQFAQNGQGGSDGGLPWQAASASETEDPQTTQPAPAAQTWRGTLTPGGINLLA